MGFKGFSKMVQKGNTTKIAVKSLKTDLKIKKIAISREYLEYLVEEIFKTLSNQRHISEVLQQKAFELKQNQKLTTKSETMTKLCDELQHTIQQANQCQEEFYDVQNSLRVISRTEKFKFLLNTKFRSHANETKLDSTEQIEKQIKKQAEPDESNEDSESLQDEDYQIPLDETTQQIVNGIAANFGGELPDAELEIPTKQEIIDEIFHIFDLHRDAPEQVNADKEPVKKVPDLAISLVVIGDGKSYPPLKTETIGKRRQEKRDQKNALNRETELINRAETSQSDEQSILLEISEGYYDNPLNSNPSSISSSTDQTKYEQKQQIKHVFCVEEKIQQKIANDLTVLYGKCTHYDDKIKALKHEIRKQKQKEDYEQRLLWAKNAQEKYNIEDRVFSLKETRDNIVDYCKTYQILSYDAPTEANIQLAGLNRVNYVQAIIACDSDQFVLGNSLIIDCSPLIAYFTNIIISKQNKEYLQKLYQQDKVGQYMIERKEQIEQLYTAKIEPEVEISFNFLDNLATSKMLSALGTGTKLLRRQLYFFILFFENDYNYSMETLEQQYPFVQRMNIDQKILLLHLIIGMKAQTGRPNDSQRVKQFMALQDSDLVTLLLKIIQEPDDLLKQIQAKAQPEKRTDLEKKLEILMSEYNGHLEMIPANQLQQHDLKKQFCEAVVSCADGKTLELLYYAFLRDNEIVNDFIDPVITQTKNIDKEFNKRRHLYSMENEKIQFDSVNDSVEEREYEERRLFRFLTEGTVDDDKIHDDAIIQSYIYQFEQLDEQLSRLKMEKRQIAKQYVDKKREYNSLKFKGNEKYAVLIKQNIQIYTNGFIYDIYSNQVTHLSIFLSSCFSNPRDSKWKLVVGKYEKQLKGIQIDVNALGAPKTNYRILCSRPIAISHGYIKEFKPPKELDEKDIEKGIKNKPKFIKVTASFKISSIIKRYADPEDHLQIIILEIVKVGNMDYNNKYDFITAYTKEQFGNRFISKVSTKQNLQVGQIVQQLNELKGE